MCYHHEKHDIFPSCHSSIHLRYVKSYSLKGIGLYRFSPPADVFANHTENPDNLGFCVPDNSSCLGSGVLNVAPCKRTCEVSGDISFSFAKISRCNESRTAVYIQRLFSTQTSNVGIFWVAQRTPRWCCRSRTSIRRRRSTSTPSAECTRPKRTAPPPLTLNR